MALRYSPIDRVLSEAIDYFMKNGFSSEAKLAYWSRKLNNAIETTNKVKDLDNAVIKRKLKQAYKKAVGKNNLKIQHKNIEGFDLSKINKSLQSELAVRIAASANLIKLNRPNSVLDTMSRFKGWVSSVPVGGTSYGNKIKIKKNIVKPLQQMTYVERRLHTDQSAKLISNVNYIIAKDYKAIGGYWRSHVHQVNYDGRPDHNAREGEFFLWRDSWAIKDGLIRPNKHQYIDEIEMPGQLVYCRCFYEYVYNIDDCPSDCLTDRYLEIKNNGRKR